MKSTGKVLAAIGVLLPMVALLGSAGCSRGSHLSITLAGSTAFQPFAEKLAEQYTARHPGVQIHVQGGGSAVGIQSAISGTAAIGMADLLHLPEEAKALTPTIVARDGIAVVVHPSNPLAELTAVQARDIFSGTLSNWKELGGPDAPIRVISREDGSGTRRSFDELVLAGRSLAPGALFQNSNGTIREAVASDVSAIGYVSIGLVNDRVRALRYNGIAPTNENVKLGAYPLARPVYFLTKGTPSAAVVEFIDFVLSREAQGTLEAEGLIPAH